MQKAECRVKKPSRQVPDLGILHSLFPAYSARSVTMPQPGTSMVGAAFSRGCSLVSLSHFSTVGSLMGNLIGGRMAIEGRLARFVYVSLYRMHLIAIHGWLKGLALILVGHVNQIIRPRLKLH